MNQVEEKQTKKREIISMDDQDNYGRRHWEVEEQEQIPNYKDEEDQGPIQRRLLEGRKDTLNLDAKIGKMLVVTKESTKDKQGGFYCELCDALMKDSASYLDHINGKKHNQLKGMNMKVERVGVDRVKDRLLLHKRQTQKQITSFAEYEKNFNENEKKKFDLKNKLKKVKHETNADIERQLNEFENKVINKNIYQRKNSDEDNVDPEMELFGIPSNFQSKKNK